MAARRLTRSVWRQTRPRAGPLDVSDPATYPGRYQTVRDNLRVKEVRVGNGDAARRFIVCHNPIEAERDKAKRDDAVSRLEAELGRIAADRARAKAKKTTRANGEEGLERPTRRRLVAALGVALLVCLAMLAIPIHVVPGNGSLRCADSLFADGFHYDNSEGLGRMCGEAAWDRLRAGALVGVGAGVFALGVGLTRRRRAVTCAAGSIIGLLAFLEIFGNLMG